MGNLGSVLKWLIPAILIVLAVLWVWKKYIRPVAVNHDSTLLFTGGLGSSKSLNSVKKAISAINSFHRSWWWDCRKADFHNKLHGLKEGDEGFLGYADEPRLYSNIPVRWGWFWNWKYSIDLTKAMLTLKQRIAVGSVVFVDELPQYVSQFEYDNPDVQGSVNEFVTFFRHYIDGLFIANAQSLDEVECHIRRKLNVYYYCFDFQKIFFFFYRVRVLRCRIGDVSVSLTNDFIEKNASWHYGLLFPRHYDTRCYRHRYDKVPFGDEVHFTELTTNKILRLDETRVSPLDDVNVVDSEVSK